LAAAFASRACAHRSRKKGGSVKISEILAQAMGIVAAFGTTGTLARDKQGNTVDVSDPKACSFCSIGACAKVAAFNVDSVGAWDDIPGVTFLNRAADELTEGLTQQGWRVNDQFSGLVPKMFQRAIELARLEEGGC
jgi:hypothetical protein